MNEPILSISAENSEIDQSGPSPAATETSFNDHPSTPQAGDASTSYSEPNINQSEGAQPSVDDWEVTRTEALKQAENDFTPKWYRDTLRKYESKFNELNTRIETFGGRQTGPESDTAKLYESAKDFQLRFSQIPTTADEAQAYARERLQEIHELNPYVAEEMLQTAFWGFAFDEQGAPNKENLQMVIDNVVGATGKVKIHDVLNAIEQLSDGNLSPEDLDWNLSDDQRALKARERQLTEESRSQRDRWQAEMDRREVEVRSNATKEIVSGIAGQFQNGVRHHLDNLRLMPAQDDTPDIQEYKREVLANIGSYVTQLEAKNPDLQYIRQRIDILNKAQKIDSNRAETYIKQVAGSLDFQERINRALRDITDKTREFANRQAKNYNRWLRGGDASIANNINNARQEPQSAGWKIPTAQRQNDTKLSAVDAGAMALQNARQTSDNIG